MDNQKQWFDVREDGDKTLLGGNRDQSSFLKNQVSTLDHLQVKSEYKEQHP